MNRLVGGLLADQAPLRRGHALGPSRFVRRPGHRLTRLTAAASAQGRLRAASTALEVLPSPESLAFFYVGHSRP
jgi:hypothetical protein